MRFREFFNIIRELSFTELRHEAMVPPRFLLLAPNEAMATAWRATLFGDASAQFVDLAEHGDGSADPFAFDAIVSIGAMDRGTARRWLELARRVEHELRIVEVDPSQEGNEQALHRIRRRLSDRMGDRALSVGRHIPVFREAAAEEIVADTSRVNAQFAALSNIPALVPVVGTILAAGADFLVLTKNQLMMIYKLAAVYNRDLDDRWRIYAEMLPVIGAGLAWRTVARQVAGIMPLLIGAVPKVMIAYAGTYVIGHGACYYYVHGEKLSREEIEATYREALTTFRQSRLGRRLGEPETPALPEPATSSGAKQAS
jgi:uncharacterized protein (DUF697 family)